MRSNLFSPEDVLFALEIFGANCGPASFAAFLERNVCDVMKYFRHFPMRQWTTLGEMEKALSECEALWQKINGKLPEAGLSLISFTGPWSQNWAGRLRHSHWIAYKQHQVFDINVNGWTTSDNWQSLVIPHLINEIPRCTGWEVLTSLDVVPSCYERSTSWQSGLQYSRKILLEC